METGKTHGRATVSDGVDQPQWSPVVETGKTSGVVMMMFAPE